MAHRESGSPEQFNPSERIPESEAIFNTEKEHIISEGLIKDIEFSSSFDEVNKEYFFKLSPADMQEFFMNVADCLRSVKHESNPVDLGEFTLELIDTPSKMRLYQIDKKLQISLPHFIPRNIEKTKANLKALMDLVAEKIKQESQEKQAELYAQEVGAVREKVKGLLIEDKLRDELIKNNRVATFFKNLNVVLGIDANSGESPIDLHGFFVEISHEATFLVSLNGIELNPDDLTDEHVARTAGIIHEAVDLSGDRAKKIKQLEGGAMASEQQLPESEPEAPTVPESEPQPKREQNLEVISTPDSSGEETEELSLEEARQNYADLYKKYASNYDRVSTTARPKYDYEPDLAAARAVYDQALKEAAAELRETIADQALANKKIFEEFVMEEERKMNRLRVGEMPPREEKITTRAWKAYARLKPTTRMLISLGVGSVIAAGTGGVSALALYAGRRAVSYGASALAGLGTTAVFEGYDKTLGKKETKESKIEALLKNRAEDISENLDAMRLEYQSILQHQANLEKKRAYWKIGVAAMAGLSTSGIIHHVISTHENIPTHTTTGVRSEGALPPAKSTDLGPAKSGAAAPSQPQVQYESQSHYDGRVEITPPVDSEPAPNISSHPAPLESAPAVKAPLISPAEHIVQTTKEADSVWKVTAHELQNNADFKSLKDDTQKTWVLSNLVNRAVEHHDQVGFSDANSIREGARLNLTEILKDHDVKDLVHRAGNLTEQQKTNILHNNEAIVKWLHEHPGKPLTESQTEEIIRAREASGLRPEPVHAAGIEVDALKQSINHWDGINTRESIRLAHSLEHVEQFSKSQRAILLSSLAEKVGDRSGAVNLGNAAEVSARMKDYLVAFPEARRFGFASYGEYAGIKDMTVKQFTEQLPPLNNELHFSLRHTQLNYRPGFFTELRNGRFQRIPLKRSYVQLGLAIERVGKASEAGKTVGQMLADHPDLFERSAAAARRSVSRVLNRSLAA